MIKTQVVKLKVNKTMQKQLDALCDYRRYCWNKGLETWQLMYEAHTLNKKDNPSPNERRVRDELVANKADWQYDLSARCLQLAIKDLANAWKNFFDSHNPIGEYLVLNQRKLPDKALKLIVPRLLMAGLALIVQEAFQKKIGLI